jgi:hypothetical protein
MSCAFNYGFVSADSHVTEPPDCYTDYIDPAFRDRAPHIVHDDKRGDVYVIPGLNTMSVPMGLVAAAGEESHQMTFAGRMGRRSKSRGTARQDTGRAFRIGAGTDRLQQGTHRPLQVPAQHRLC